MFKVPDWEDAPNNLNFTKALPVSLFLGLMKVGFQFLTLFLNTQSMKPIKL